MTVYRDAGHCIARVMSIEANDGTTKAGWQTKYQSGWPEPKSKGSGLSSGERLTQDSMTRAMLRRELSLVHWHALTAKRSINDREIALSIKWLARNISTPAHSKFKVRAVMAWVLPQKAEGQKSTRSLPDSFYQIHTWDGEGRPEGTLRRWKYESFKWLNEHSREAHNRVDELLQEHGLKIDEAA